MSTCQHCDAEITIFDYKPTGDEDADVFEYAGPQWATDESGDPNEDFICPARESSARWPNGRPHEMQDA